MSEPTDTQRLARLETQIGGLESAVRQMANSVDALAKAEIRFGERATAQGEENRRLGSLVLELQLQLRETENTLHRWINRAWGIWAVVSVLFALLAGFAVDGIKSATQSILDHDRRIQRLEIKTGVVTRAGIILTSAPADADAAKRRQKPAPAPMPIPPAPAPDPVVIQARAE